MIASLPFLSIVQSVIHSSIHSCATFVVSCRISRVSVSATLGGPTDRPTPSLIRSFAHSPLHSAWHTCMRPKQQKERSIDPTVLPLSSVSVHPMIDRPIDRSIVESTTTTRTRHKTAVERRDLPYCVMLPRSRDEEKEKAPPPTKQPTNQPTKTKLVWSAA